MTVEFRVGDVFDRLAEIPDGSVDLVVTSPPFLALRSYLPADHPDKGKEIGSEATPAEFLDTLLAVTAELRRVLAPHGSIAIELGDTYAGSGGAGGDYGEGGWREGQPKWRGYDGRGPRDTSEMDKANVGRVPLNGGSGWPLAKSKTLIPEVYRIALAYGLNPLTGSPSPAGQWRIRNVVTWCRPNPPVGALGDKWRPATSDVVVACLSGKRYWDDLATRRAWQVEARGVGKTSAGYPEPVNWVKNLAVKRDTHGGAPLLDYWVIPPGGYQGSHYATYPPELVVPLVKAMCPERVCRTCGEPSRRIVERQAVWADSGLPSPGGCRHDGIAGIGATGFGGSSATASIVLNEEWTDCGHDSWRPGLVLDPFAGSGTTLMVAQGHGHDAIGIDLDSRNLELARERVGPMFLEVG